MRVGDQESEERRKLKRFMSRTATDAVSSGPNWEQRCQNEGYMQGERGKGRGGRVETRGG